VQLFYKEQDSTAIRLVIVKDNVPSGTCYL